MDALRTTPAKLDSEPSPALLAKGALRRLATERIEPTPENYAKAYRLEAGNPKGSSVLPARAQRLVETIAARAFDADAAHASADFTRAIAEGHWDQAERALEAAPAQAGEALAVLIERIIRGIERGGQNWTAGRRKVGIQRVLDASRSDTRRLHQRLSQLVTSWESDSVSTLAHLDEEPAPTVRPAARAGSDDAIAATATSAASAIAAGGASVPLEAPVADETAAQRVPMADAQAAAAPAVNRVQAVARLAQLEQLAAQGADWQRIAAALSHSLRQALPTQDSANRDLIERLEAQARLLAGAGATADAAQEMEGLCRSATRVLQHRHHLFDQLGKLTLELTASLTDLAENDSWVQGQCDAMRLKIEEGLTARGVRAVGDMLHNTRKRHGELRGERERARDALKVLINRMLSELGELGSKTGNFHESVGRYAAVIEEADTLESLTGVVRKMVEESRTVQSLVQQTQQRLQEEHTKATDLTERVSQLEGEMKRLSDEVSTDQLTQIANRRGLMMAFEVERARMERTGEPLAVGLLDIDNFKRLNDELGHVAGDEALKSLAAIVSKTLRPTDRVARYGGEEFVVLLPQTPADEGEQILTRLQRSLTGGLFMHKQKQVFVTFSAGLTLHRLDERIEDALERADQALYEAKRTGKNRTCLG
ncbi:MAG: diguanylate cyclase domain-containing protein [Caldimonas sp.]